MVFGCHNLLTVDILCFVCTVPDAKHLAKIFFKDLKNLYIL